MRAGDRMAFWREAALFMPWVAAGLVFRLWRASLQLVMYRDETAYAYQIKHVLSGAIFQDPTYFTFPPAFCFLAAPIALVTNDPEFAGRLVSCIAGPASAIAVFYLARDLYSYRTAALAAALTAVFPSYTSVAVMSEPLFGFFLVLGLYLGNSAADTGNRARYALFGLVMALAYLTRPEGIFVFFAYLAVILLAVRGRAPLRRTAALAGLSLVFFMLLALPYMLQLRAHFGSWEISGKTRINLAKVKALESGDRTSGMDGQVDRMYKNFEKAKRGLFGDMADQVRDMAGRYPANLKKEAGMIRTLAGYPVLLLFAAGLALVYLEQGRLRRLGLLAAGLLPVLVFPTVMVIDRLVVPYLPLIIIIGSYAAVRLSERAASAVFGADRPVPAQLVSGALGLAMMWGVYSPAFIEWDTRKILIDYPTYNHYYKLRLQAEEVRPFIAPGSKIICRDNIFAYYAGAEYVYIPETDLRGLERLAAKEGARYFLYGPTEQATRPKLLDELVTARRLKEIPDGPKGPRLIYARGGFMLYEMYGG